VDGEDLLDISGVIWRNIDALAEGQVTFKAPTWSEYFLKEAPLKMFEKAEWFNRLVAAHAADFSLRAAGTSDVIRKAMVAQTVRETQYGAHALNTPPIFLGTSWLSDPALRQFMTFPARTFTGFLYAPKMLAGDGAKAINTAMKLWIRAYGYGAVTYETLRAAAGADMSRGTAPYAFLDIFNEDRFIGPGGEGAFITATPPVVDIAANFTRWALGDPEALRGWASRVVPGGVALSRLAGLTGPVDQDWFPGRLLRQMGGHYVGWKEPAPDGRVPVYKGDGTLVSYQSPLTMIARGLGMDMRKFADESAMARWLANNRDEMVSMKRQALTAIINSDYGRFQQLDAQMQKRFGIPLKFTKEQVRSQLTTRQVTRTERLLNRMPSEVRGEYQSAMRQHAASMGLSPEQLEGGMTSSQRTQAGAYRPQPLSPEAQEYLDAIMMQQVTPLEDQ
jgi:hypothetical protein